ncbi:arginase [Psychroflexus sp. YR1-1]|uniref:Arginase n=1 Tax=Psychroflexus aurantiacus TaxID=2709310 RepID=A0A6B3R391_9FLAO|nr:arginase family protein [Psychroflexus aurantiacus]NEV93557.1 arginase [Psychroflexus aurantiacus]
MNYFKFSDTPGLLKYIDSESKGQPFGEKVVSLTNLSELETTDAEYVLFGIPTLSNSADEFKPGDFKMFQAVLQSLLNIQHNDFNRAENLVVLGELDVELISHEINQLKTVSEKKERYEQIVKETTHSITQAICNLGKIPIVIGGDSGDTLNLLKASNSTEQSPLNLLDLSTHVTFELENSGEFFDKYSGFGLHKNTTTQAELDVSTTSKKLSFQFYEDCLHLTTLDKCVKFKNAVDFLNGHLGFKLDLQSIQGMSTNCDSSSGFSVRDIRTFLKVIRKEQAKFFHMCGFEVYLKENTGFILSYFISDFIRKEN